MEITVTHEGLFYQWSEEAGKALSSNAQQAWTLQSERGGTCQGEEEMHSRPPRDKPSDVGHIGVTGAVFVFSKTMQIFLPWRCQMQFW